VFPTSIEPPPNIIVAHTPFFSSTDTLLGFRALRCAYPHAKFYMTSAPPNWKRTPSNFMLPYTMSFTKYTMDRFQSDPVMRWLSTKDAARLGMVASTHSSGLLELAPMETFDGRTQVCAGPTEFDTRGMVHDCSMASGPVEGASSNVHDRGRNPRARIDFTHADSVEFFAQSHKPWSVREEMVAGFIPHGARVLDLGCASENLGVHLKQTRRNITYCPVDATARYVPFRSAVCNLNMGELPLTIRPQPTHIVMEGVLIYLLDKLLTLLGLACAYPSATVVLLLDKFANASAHCVAEAEHTRRVLMPMRNVSVHCRTSGFATVLSLEPVKGKEESTLFGQRCSHHDRMAHFGAPNGLCYSL